MPCRPCQLVSAYVLTCLLQWLLPVEGVTIPHQQQQRVLSIPPSLQDEYNSIQHAQIWQTVDGIRPFLESLQSLPSDTWQPPEPSADHDDSAIPGAVPDPTGQCLGTLGSWCHDWWASKVVSKGPYQRGSKTCANNCNGVGTCNYDVGICHCPAGWKGDDCTTPHKRPCTKEYSSDDDPIGVPTSFIDPVTKEDKDVTVVGWTASRCTGVCDDDIGACYCGWNSTHARIPAPPGSPPGTPPIRIGRPLMDVFQSSKDMQNRSVSWGTVDKDLLYGPSGWCNAEKGKEAIRASCIAGGLQGPNCDMPTATFCPNQCNARGTCISGFCKCDPNWYGTACDKLRANAKPASPLTRSTLLNLTDVWQHVPQKGASKHPLIYVYDLPSDYNAKLLQYRIARSPAVWREFNLDNTTRVINEVYAVETYLHETLLTSRHRTLNPEEADFFYVPVYVAVLFWPVLGWADGPWCVVRRQPQPFSDAGCVQAALHRHHSDRYYAPHPYLRVMHATNLWLEVKRWIQQHYPWWDRRQGRDHIWFAPHDEGGCYMPTEIYNTSIILTHWGRTDVNHVSGTAYAADNYSLPMNDFPKHQPGDWRDLYGSHPCYTPGKDLVIPAFKSLEAWAESPLLGNAPLKRDILFFFRGDVGLHRSWWYSRGIRQTLYRLAREDRWRQKYGMLIGSSSDYPGNYSQYLARSKFCLVAMGDGWSARSEDAVLHGCIPVLINDHVEPVLYGLVDWDAFSIRVPQSRMVDLPQILLNVTETQLTSMQQALAQVWTRFAYVTGPWFRTHVPHVYSQHLHKWKDVRVTLAHPYRPLTDFPVRKDAFHTIIQWLASKIPQAHSQNTSA